MDLPQYSFGRYVLQDDHASGLVCWNGLALGDYTIYEVLPGGWIAIYPDSYGFTLTEAGDSFVFFNKVEGASALEKSRLGRIKGMFSK